MAKSRPRAFVDFTHTVMVSGICAFTAYAGLCLAEPIVLSGSMVPAFLGKDIRTLRMTDAAGDPIPFQIDEVTTDGEYVCGSGVKPNADSGNGRLDNDDEIVFLREDAAMAGGRVTRNPTDSSQWVPLILTDGRTNRTVYLTDDPVIKPSGRSYITYDPAKEQVITPFYYAVFGRKRFHFIRAGIRDFGGSGFIDLTRQLKINIHVAILWGLIPINFTEDNLICTVKRYKAGPIRLIRRGDFHLNLGLGIKGSSAAVNQVCYPQMVGVPVYVHLPIRLKTVCRDAWLEIAPVISLEGQGFSFRIPQHGINMNFASPAVAVDTIIPILPENEFFQVDNRRSGFGWLLQARINPLHLAGSGFVFMRTPGSDFISGGCGYRLLIRDLPKGRYKLTNWVTFCKTDLPELQDNIALIREPAVIRVAGDTTAYRNRIGGR